MTEICDIAKETIQVLRYFDLEFTLKISKNFLELLKKASEKSNIIVNIDPSKKLNEQNISEECKELIALLYYNYFSNETEKKEILKIWKDNEVIYENVYGKDKKIFKKYRN